MLGGHSFVLSSKLDVFSGPWNWCYEHFKSLSVRVCQGVSIKQVPRGKNYAKGIFRFMYIPFYDILTDSVD